MASSPSPPRVLPVTGMMRRRRIMRPCQPLLPARLCLSLPFLLQDRFPDLAQDPARRPPHLPPLPSPGAGRSQSGLRLCWCHPSPSLSPGDGVVGGARGVRAPCRPGQPIAVKGWALGPPWGKEKASGGCLMGSATWSQVGFWFWLKGWCLLRRRDGGGGWQLMVLHLMWRRDPTRKDKAERRGWLKYCQTSSTTKWFSNSCL